jgi:hypothetical protein
MTTSDLARLGRTKLTAEKFARAFSGECFGKTDTAKRTAWLEQNGLGELANYMFLNPETIKSSKFAIYAIKRTTEDPKDKIATDLRNIAALINPVIKKQANNKKMNGTSTPPPMAIADAPVLKALPAPPRMKAAIEEIEEVNSAASSTTTTTTKKNKKKRARDDLVLKGDVAEKTVPASDDAPSKKAKEEKEEEAAEEVETEDVMEEDEQGENEEEEAQDEGGEEEEVPAAQPY